MSKIKVFVSSTVRDLGQERSIVKEVLENSGVESFLSEEASSTASSPRDVCLDQITECDIFILIIGERYGYVPESDSTPGSPYDGKISVTEGEFLKARELLKPILVFVKDTQREHEEMSCPS